jgi:Rieske Fe-S protein
MSEPTRTACEHSGDRRGFLKKALAGLIGAVLGLLPVGVGLNFFLDPLRRHTGASSTVRVTSLEALPADGVPRRFEVVASKLDAWNKFTDLPVGAVYLRRLKEGTIQAFSATCPHAGCSVGFEQARNLYSCPCHLSTFNIAGGIEDRSSPAPRGLDSLEVEVRGGAEIWVKFQNFQAGRPEKVPVA